MTEQFFIVGAQRSGTTYLYKLLDQHPDIEMAKPMRPEPKFFLREDLSQLTLDNYHTRFFSEETPLRGEKSTTYIESEYAARSISQWFPDAKIIFLLRNPIDRAISNYKFSRQHNVETLPFKDAILKEETRRDSYDHTQFSTSPYGYLKRGRYIEYIQQYECYFPREQLLVYLFEELAGSASAVQNIYAALGIDNTFVPSGVGAIVNASVATEGITLEDEVRRYMKDYFVGTNLQLAEFLGRSLEIWDEASA